MTAIVKNEGRAAAMELLEPRLLCSATSQNVSDLAQANNEFAYEFYQQVRGEQGNLLFSPLSISAALAMVYAGARGQTAREMASVLHFDQLGDGVHQAFADLLAALESRTFDNPATAGPDVTLNIADAIWGQQRHAFLDSYLDLLADYYDGGFQSTNFAADPEGARQQINNWIAQQTRDMIQNAVPPGFITDMTRMVLANALYFKAGWMYSFDPDQTQDWQFHFDGSPTGRMMHLTAYLEYAETPDYQAVELPYMGGQTAMLVVLPKEGRFDAVESSLSSSLMDQLVGGLHPTRVSVYLPKLDYSWGKMLGDALADMGMPLAFTPKADLSGMDGMHDLRISDVLHKAVIELDEEGTAAAAVTVVGVITTSIAPPAPMPASFTADRPFLYVIRDIPTDSALFVGRVCDGEALVATDAYRPVVDLTSPPLLWFTQPFKGISPASYFDERYYLANNADVRAAVQAGQLSCGWAHFLSFGANEGRAPSGLFDEQFYLHTNPDVAEQVSHGRYRSGFEHYVVFGSREGRDPNALFQEAYYAGAAYADVKAAVAAGVFRNGFEHYMLFGAAEGRNSSGFFTEQHYRTAETDVSAAIQAGQFRCGLEHYLEFGYKEGRQPLWSLQASMPWTREAYVAQAFDESWYLSAYGDVAAAVASGLFRSGLEHFAYYGWPEGRARLAAGDWRLVDSSARTTTVNGRNVLTGYLYNGILDIGLT